MACQWKSGCPVLMTVGMWMSTDTVVLVRLLASSAGRMLHVDLTIRDSVCSAQRKQRV